MGIVVLRNGEIWKRANWVLRELLDLMTDEFLPDDGEALYTLVQAEAFTALQLDHEEPALADRLEKVLLRVVHAVVDGRLPVRPSRILQDPRSMEQFRDSMRELLKMTMVPIKGGGEAS
jgi:hypothetical protein